MTDTLPAPLSSDRLRYIDALRAIAALLVVWLHAASTFAMTSPETAATGRWFTAIPGYIDVGHIGVVVFFLISGFVIPFSILPDRAAPVGSFAIKRILPHMTDNSEFIGMFIDEAKLAAQLNHPNIIHIYDLGKINRDYYIAMEYVDGKDLRSLLNAGRRNGVALPAGLALLIAARLASALDYAHRKRDFEGREIGLVHRDVSPQNVLLTFEGDVKLCDFGIAKAAAAGDQLTNPGQVKGKYAYMSPEQTTAQPLDGRSDVFSLAICMWELLTGKYIVPRGDAVAAMRMHQGRPVIALEGVASMNDAEELAGLELRVPEASLTALAPDTYYEHDLRGCRVETVDGRVLGEVRAIEGGGGATRLVIGAGRGEIQIPFVHEICVIIDVSGRRIVVDAPDGLVDVNA